LVFRPDERTLTIQLNFVLYLDFSRQHFAGEIQRIRASVFASYKARRSPSSLSNSGKRRRSSRTDWDSSESNSQPVNASTDAARGDPFKIESSPKKSPSR